MDVLSFIASIIGSLAWPSFLFAIVLLLHKPIRDLLPFLQKLEYKEFELEFGHRVEEVTAEVARQLPKESRKALPSPESNHLLRLADISPRSAVLEAWRSVETMALQVANKLGANISPGQTYQAIRFLERSEKLDRNVVSLLRDLRGLRNEAAHTPEFVLSKEAALEYAASASALASYLQSTEEASNQRL